VIHGVVRWRACHLIMRLHEEFGLSVSDDTIYRALKNLGFSHVSARPITRRARACNMADLSSGPLGRTRGRREWIEEPGQRPRQRANGQSEAEAYRKQ
jgi:hypothetical protein